MNVVVRRLAQLVIALILVTAFTAALLSMVPGDPVEAIVPFSSPEQREQIRESIGLNEPLPVQYWNWLTNFLTGDLGNYYDVSSERPVATPVKDALPVSILLMIYAQFIALVVAIPLGVLTAYRAGSKVDKGVNTLAFGLLAIPNFALALILIYYLGIQWELYPTQGYTAPGLDPATMNEHLKSMFMPALSLAAGQIAIYMRLLRSDMIATLQEDFITMAKAKGMPSGRILWRHAFRPSSITLLTVAGLNVGTLIGGAVVIEVIFQLPGMGLLLFQAIAQRQYVAVQSMVAIIAIGYIIINMVIDILYAVVDPRIRHARAVG
jgi:peptide/nickel transport system permease protein